MNSKERIITAFELKIPDKVPVCPRLDSLWLKNAGEDLAGEIIRASDLAFYVDMLPDHVLYLGEEARGRCREETEGDLRHKTIATPKGPLTSKIHVEQTMMDWAEKHFFETAADVEKALSIPYRPPALDFTEYREWEKKIGNEGIVLAHIADALCCPGLWFSPEDYVIQACHESTDLVCRLLERVNRSIMDVTKQCLDAGIRFFMTSGPELASQTIMGPEWFPRLVAPYDSQVAQMIRRNGGYTWCHCHGKIAKIHKHLAGLGIYVLSPCEKPPQGDIELAELKASIGRQVCLAGDLDDLSLISTGNRALIREETLACLKAGMPGGGYILGGTEGCVFSKENAEGYLYMCELRDQFGVYMNTHSKQLPGGYRA
ncbi:MAG: hypothetical protein HYV36_06645 [Lentisphaerae bacterium]|nr:hypothetical protein [Lentisphaerota bacterium]